MLLLLRGQPAGATPAEPEPVPVHLKRVTTSGTVLDNIDFKGITSVEWELNGAGSAALEFPTTFADIASLGFGDEIQIWRNGEPIWWGFVSRPDADAERTRFECRGLLGYFDRRYIGRADRVNRLTNPEAEDDLTGWTTSGTGITSSASTTWHITGTKSFKLVQPTAGVDSHLNQSTTISGGPIGNLVTLAAHFFIDPAGWVGPAFGARGLTVITSEAGTVRDVQSDRIDSDTPRGVTRRAEVETWVPPNKTYTVETRFYAPGGTIYWDASSLTLMESLTNQSNPDQAVMVRRIVDYLQDNDVFTHGKSNLRIQATTASCPETGVERFRAYQFVEHINGGQAIREFTELDNGLDVSIAITATSRIFHTHYPQKGTDRSGSITISNEHLSGLSWSFDGEQAVTSVVVLGEGDGPDREEGGAVDTGLYDGKTFELVDFAPTGMPIDALDDYAEELLAARRNPTNVKASLPQHVDALLDGVPELLGVVDVGDTIDVDIDHGYITVSGDHRIIAMSWDPPADVLTLELVPA